MATEPGIAATPHRGNARYQALIDSGLPTRLEPPAHSDLKCSRRMDGLASHAASGKARSTASPSLSPRSQGRGPTTATQTAADAIAAIFADERQCLEDKPLRASQSDGFRTKRWPRENTRPLSWRGSSQEVCLGRTSLAVRKHFVSTLAAVNCVVESANLWKSNRSDDCDLGASAFP